MSDPQQLKPQSERLTIVTIFFDAEVPLLELQLRSLARFASESLIDKIIVIYNESRTASRRLRSRLIRAAGRHAPRLEIVNRADVSNVPSTTGWRSQQILKLEVADRITSEHYVLLDAKNHFIRTTTFLDFLAPDGRARGARHSYETHPLKPLLIKTLDLFQLPSDLVDDFPSTATPYVMHTGVVRDLTRKFGGGVSFGEAFEEAGVTEFFLYSCWILANGSSLHELYDGQPIEAPTVWAGACDNDDVERVIAQTEAQRAAFFAVHRRALGRMKRPARMTVAEFWTKHRLFDNPAAARRFLATYRIYYFVAMGAHKMRNRRATQHSAQP